MIKLYGEKKGASGKAGTTWKASDKVGKFARNTGLSKTYLGKAAKWAKGKTGGPKQMLKGAAPYFAPDVGRMAGEFVGGDTGGDIGQTVGFAAMQKGLKTPQKAKSFSKFLIRKVPQILGKAGAIAMADSPAPGFADLFALGMSVYEVGKLYNEWTEQE